MILGTVVLMWVLTDRVCSLLFLCGLFVRFAEQTSVSIDCFYYCAIVGCVRVCVWEGGGRGVGGPANRL